MVIREMLRNGVADKIIPWDDCAYIYNSLFNSHLIRSAGFFAAAANLNFAHVPLANIHGTLAMLLSGDRIWTPHLIPGFYLFLVVLSIFRSLRGAVIIAPIGFVLCVVSIPAFFLFASTLKTDFLAGAILFILVVEVFLVDGATFSVWRRLYTALLAALFVLCKPTAFYFPLLLGLVFVLQHLRDWSIEGRSALNRRRLAITAGLVLLPVLVYAAIVVPNLDFFRFYITQALSNPLWQSDIALRDRLLFYLPFATPARSWGGGLTSFLLIGFGFLVAVARHHMKRTDLAAACAIVVIVFACYAPLTISPQYSQQLGAPLAGSILALVLLALRIAMRDRWLQLPVATGLLVTSAVTFEMPVQRWIHWPGDSYSVDDVAQASQIVQDFSRTIIAQSPVHGPAIYLNHSPIPYFNFVIEIYRQSGAFVGMSQPYVFDPATIDRAVSSAHFVLLHDAPGTTDRYTDLGHKARAHILLRDDLFELARASIRQHNYVLYKVGPIPVTQ
ncbi:hypothetical protein [Sabulicella rubraurantiaca]|uniref:hypothetical protein n=1 Tax=Sabulicella rubraurantiaca TaxID=2811429 RepID=UPI001A9788A8|nr:hypothetical protein [Sabulicella rubraurantiaca]